MSRIATPPSGADGIQGEPSSDARFRAMFHGHSAVKLIIDPASGEIVDANEAAARFYGWTIAELKLMRIQQINMLPPDEVQQLMVSAASLPNARFEFRHRTADGSIRDVEVYSNRIHVEERTYLYSIIHDISDRKRTERALQVSEQRFRMLAENMADAVWVMDDESERYVYVSPSMERIGGRSVEEMMRHPVRESVTEESYAALRRLREERVREFERGVERTYVDVVETTAPDGSRITVEVHGRLVRNAESGRLEVIGVSRDISARRRAEEALHAAHDRLRRAEAFAHFGHWEAFLDERIVRASEETARLYGFASTELSLDDVRRCALPEHRPTLDAALRDLIERNVPYDQEFRIRRASDGEIVHLHSKAEYDAAHKRVFGVVQDISDRKRVEEEREGLIAELRLAIEEVKTLTGIVPICASCKKIRDDKGYWEQVEAYLTRHTEAEFSHGICPDCMGRLYPDLGA